MNPSIGRIVWYRTDGRNGLAYDLPAIITCTAETHPGDYPDGKRNPLPVPESDTHVHLTVFTPGGFGTTLLHEGNTDPHAPKDTAEFVGAETIVPGSGSYVEWNVPYWEPVGEEVYAYESNSGIVPARTWRWPVIAR